jgi:hypothetical protein
MNLSVTGKKMNTPNPSKKVPDFNSPIIIQPKLITQKPLLQTKPKLNQSHNVTQQKKASSFKI